LFTIRKARKDPPMNKVLVALLKMMNQNPNIVIKMLINN
jgi:hypothetical protein